MNAIIISPAEKLSQCTMLLLARADADLAALEANPTRYGVAEFNRRLQAILDYRAWLLEQYQREKAAAND